jgi:hypothetical protein
MEKRIFYSWQSDLPNNSNRGFIHTALEKAIQEINADDDFSLIPFLDRDTAGISGSPDISGSIFDKIRNSDTFVCDVSIVNSHAGDLARPSPNPNVLIELGYAIGVLDWSRIILIMNEHFGDVGMLPFDLRGRRVLVYSMDPGSPEKAPERNKVSSILKSGVMDILLNSPVSSLTDVQPTSTYESDDVSKQALLRYNTLKSVTYVQPKNEGLIKYANEYINLDRYDLAVLFAAETTYIQPKNELLIHIAKASLGSGDFEIAQKAIEAITYVQQKNALGLELIKRMQS